MEAPDNERLVKDLSRATVLPPPLTPLAEHAAPVRGLPEEFLLTVFNPYREVKGGDVMLATAGSSALPIVWCFSRSTVEFDPQHLRHRNVLALENLSQAQLRFLYEHCTAFVSFSRAEGFGWAIADALQYGAPIVSRPIGVLTLEGLDLREVYFYEDEEELIARLQNVEASRVTRDLGRFGPEAFRSRLEHLVGTTT
jgi:hypothetical protein